MTWSYDGGSSQYVIMNMDESITKDTQWHKWIDDTVLCQQAHPDHVITDNPFCATKISADVTCQECKEWIHG